VVGCSKWTLLDQGDIRWQLIGNGVDAGDVQGFVDSHLRQYTGHGARQQGLSRTRRADHQQIVVACRRHFQSALDLFLALDLAEVNAGQSDIPLGGRTQLWGYLHPTREVVTNGVQRINRDHLDIRNQRRLWCIHQRHHNLLETLFSCKSRHRQYAAHVPHTAIQRKLTHN